MRRTLNADHLAALVAGHVVDLDGVRLALADIGRAAIRRAVLPALQSPPTIPPGRPVERAVAAYSLPIADHTRWPHGARLLGYVDRHPDDDHAMQHAVVQLTNGDTLAWNGNRFRPLPPNWQEVACLTFTRSA